MRVALPPAEFLRQCFEYRPDTGELISRPRPVGHFRNAHVAAIWNAKFAGKVRGVPDKEGYLIVTFERQKYRAHRIIWTMVNGHDAPEDIDHINRDKGDNRLSNLRACSRKENSCNGPKRANNTSGLKGVGAYEGRWRARIKVDGRSIHLGIFDDKEDAHRAFLAAAAIYQGAFAAA